MMRPTISRSPRAASSRLGRKSRSKAHSALIDPEPGFRFLFDAFSSREPVSMPDQARDRLSLENAMPKPFATLDFRRARGDVGARLKGTGLAGSTRRNRSLEDERVGPPSA